MNIKKMLLDNACQNRPGRKINDVMGLVIHWVANPNSTAEANRNYFNKTDRFASAHFILGLEGEVIQCIPDDEIAYHVGAKVYQYTPLAKTKFHSIPSSYLIGIECTHVDWTGLMNQETYKALLELVVKLCKDHKLNPLSDLYLHQDITGKDCHKWFVEHIAEWKNFKQAIYELMLLDKIDEEALKEKFKRFSLSYQQGNPSDTCIKLTHPMTTGMIVEAIQRALVKNGYYLLVDGVYGITTKSAIEDFQKENKLKVDGIVGPETLEKLNIQEVPAGKVLAGAHK